MPDLSTDLLSLFMPARSSHDDVMTTRTSNAPAHWIGGETVAGGADTIDVVNPATGEVVAAVPAGTAAEVDRAVAAAAVAFPGWAGTGVAARAAIVQRISEGLQ